MSINISDSRMWELEQIASGEYPIVDHRDLLKPCSCNEGQQRISASCDLLIVKSLLVEFVGLPGTWVFSRYCIPLLWIRNNFLPVMYIELCRSEVGVGLYPQAPFPVCSMWRVGVSKCMDFTCRAIGWWIRNDFWFVVWWSLRPSSG